MKVRIKYGRIYYICIKEDEKLMAELRWNPMIQDWVMIASHRQNRPNMPKESCPFCPGEGKNIPKDYDVLKYDNDFPALSQNPPDMDYMITPDGGDIYKIAPSYGKCEVILFSPDHNGSLYQLSDNHMYKLIDLWIDRFNDIKSDENIKYIFIFENRGDIVGVTMSHPHGQIYGYSMIPKKIELELDSCRDFYNKNNKCLFCRMNEEETAFNKRIICENDSFIAYIPFFADYVYGTYILPKKHKLTISDLNEQEKRDFGNILKKITGAYDNLFDYKFPYMMCMHNAPVNINDEKLSEYYHFHVEFYPPMRSIDKQQFQASSETGVWAHCNPSSPEEKACEMRNALKKFEESGI